MQVDAGVPLSGTNSVGSVLAKSRHVTSTSPRKVSMMMTMIIIIMIVSAIMMMIFKFNKEKLKTCMPESAFRFS